MEYMLFLALSKHHEETFYHSLRVGLLSWGIAQQLALSEEVCDIIFRAGTVHDIGKINVPVELLNKKSKLSEQEYQRIKLHVENGLSILMEYNVNQTVIDIVAGHHERENGKGYPLGTTQQNELSKILAVCDVFDALTGKREYRSALSQIQAINKMKHGECGQLNLNYICTLEKVLIQIESVYDSVLKLLNKNSKAI